MKNISDFGKDNDSSFIIMSTAASGIWWSKDTFLEVIRQLLSKPNRYTADYIVINNSNSKSAYFTLKDLKSLCLARRNKTEVAHQQLFALEQALGLEHDQMHASYLYLLSTMSSYDVPYYKDYIDDWNASLKGKK